MDYLFPLLNNFSYLCTDENNLMKCKSIIILLGVLLLLGCQKGSVNEQLAQVDNLITEELFDSAYHMVNSVEESSIHNKDAKAHYDLLRVQTAYLVNHPMVSSDSLLDVVIAYYQQHMDKEKLTDAYYYKAVGANLRQDYNHSILLYKNAEQLASQTQNKRQQYKIAEGISYVNRMSKNYDLQLKYAKEALDLAMRLNNGNWIAYSIYAVEYAYSNLGMEDSARLYLEKIPTYLKYVDKKELPVLLTDMGYLFMEEKPELAKKYLIESLSYKELTSTYSYLADIFYDEGDHKKAQAYWQKALLVNDASPKDDVIRNLIEYDIERGKLDSISERVTEIIAIRDSIDQQLSNNTIRDLQSRFDHEVMIHKKDRAISRWQVVFCLLLLIMVALISLFMKKRDRAKIRLQKSQMDIYDLTLQIQKLEETNNGLKLNNEEKAQEIEANMEKIRSLNKQIEQIMDEKAPRLEQGRMRYDQIMKNETTKHWNKNDFDMFLEYYTAINYRTVERLKRASRIVKLTRSRLFYLILIEMGKTDKEIIQIMSISQETLRGYRHRTKLKDTKTS